MNLINNLGVFYKGDYIKQGSNLDKINQSTKLGIKNIEFLIKNDGKGIDIDNLSNIYDKTVIYHLEALKNNLSNLSYFNEVILKLIKNKIKLFTIDASVLPLDIYEFSTLEEQQNYIKNIASGIALLVSNNIEVAIENVKDINGESLFGKKLENISDLVIYTKDILIKKYSFTNEKANKYVGVSININNLDDNENLKDWFTIFYNDIKCIKIGNRFESIKKIEELLDLIIQNNIDKPVLLETTSEIEKINNEYRKMLHLVNNKLENKPLNFNDYVDIIEKNDEYLYNNISPSQGGFTNVLIISMIILTLIIAALMFYIKLK